MGVKKIMICGCAVLFTLLDVVLTEENKLDFGLDDEHSIQKRMDASQDAVDSYDFTNQDLYELIKRGSLLRFGKRGSLLRFGKRGSLFRFGKRGSLFRFGKRVRDDLEPVAWMNGKDELFDDELKRSSLFRFGKKSALFRFGRSAGKGPHTPWRFGREDEEELERLTSA